MKDRYKRITYLYCNGRLFEGYDNANSAILSAIFLQLGEHKRFGPKVKDKVVMLLKSVNWMCIAHLGLLQHIALPAISAYLTGGDSQPHCETCPLDHHCPKIGAAGNSLN